MGSGRSKTSSNDDMPNGLGTGREQKGDSCRVDIDLSMDYPPSSSKYKHRAKKIPLICAVDNDDMRAFDKAISKCKNVDKERDWCGDTALTSAAMAENHYFLKVLLDKGANPIIVNNNGDTALLVSASRGDVKACRMLLDASSAVTHIT